MTAHERRAGTTEAVFRDVNERVMEIDRAHGIPLGDLATFLCECADSTCLERVAVSAEEYERIRASGRRFLLIPGHESPEVERVVERRDGYVIAEKIGEAAEEAEELDPRG